MPYDHDQVDNLDAVIDDLADPTTLETWQATDAYDSGIVAASAVRRALAGGGGGVDETQLFTGNGDPVAPINADFKVHRVSSNTAGTFTLTFRGQTTTPLAFDATGTEIAAALAALSSIGSGNVIPYPGQETHTPNSSSDGTKILFVGALGCAATETPTVGNDTTDNGVLATDHVTGAAGTPDATHDGDFYYDFTASRMWVLQAEPSAGWLLAGYNGGRVTSSIIVGDDPGGDSPTYVEIDPGGVVTVVVAGKAAASLQSPSPSFGMPVQISVPADYDFDGLGIPFIFWLYATLGAGAGTITWGVSPDGYEVSVTLPEPADDLIQPGQVFSYFDATNGAAKFVRKGKTLDGTVVKVESAMT